MEIKYQLEPTDLEALNAFVHRDSPLGLALRKPQWLLAGVVVVVSAMVFDRSSPIISTFSIVLFVAFLSFFWLRRHKGLRKRGSAVFAPMTLLTSPEGLQAIAPGRSSTAAWSEVKGYGDTPNHIFVMLDGVAGHVIPKRNQSAPDLAALLADLQQYTRPLPAGRSPVGCILKLVLVWLVLLGFLFASWQLGQSRKQVKDGAAQQGDEADER